MCVALTENISLPPAQHHWIKPTPLHRSHQLFCACLPPLCTSLSHYMHPHEPCREHLPLPGTPCPILLPKANSHTSHKTQFRHQLPQKNLPLYSWLDIIILPCGIPLIYYQAPTGAPFHTATLGTLYIPSLHILFIDNSLCLSKL